MLKQSLKLKQLQKLSPQQIQFIKLLQVPTTMLEQRIKEELEENPALEEGLAEQSIDAYDFSDDQDFNANESKESDEYAETAGDDLDLNDYLAGDDTPDYKLNDNNFNRDDEENDRQPPIAISNSFHDQLEQQLNLLQLDDDLSILAAQLVGSIDDDGYLRRDLQAICDDIAFAQNKFFQVAAATTILQKIQMQFDPAGVGARDLKECLLIQLKRHAQTDATKWAIKVIEKQFEEYSKKHFDKVAKAIGITEHQLKQAHQEILRLNPRPGNTVADNNKTHHVIPDFLLHNEDGILDLRLNARNAPELRISTQYRDMLKDYAKAAKGNREAKEAITFVKQKLDAAKWFIDAIKQRQHTLLTTMSAIVQMQESFFLTGDRSKLKPMILKDIADQVNLDISTVSRVANSKYIQTEYGTFLLKDFFSEGIATESGEDASSIEVKKILEDAIANEDKSAPLSDDKLAAILQEKGYNIARRTVTKYREQMHIQVARLRKDL